MVQLRGVNTTFNNLAEIYNQIS